MSSQGNFKYIYDTGNFTFVRCRKEFDLSTIFFLNLSHFCIRFTVSNADRGWLIKKTASRQVQQWSSFSDCLSGSNTLNFQQTI